MQLIDNIIGKLKRFSSQLIVHIAYESQWNFAKYLLCSDKIVQPDAHASSQNTLLMQPRSFPSAINVDGWGENLAVGLSPLAVADDEADDAIGRWWMVNKLD